MVNKVILIGRVGQDPEIRTLQNGQQVAKFSLATTERWTDKESGERKEQTEWHTLTAWRALAGVIDQWVRKGALLYIEGRLHTREWEDKQGNKRYSTEIVCDVMKMLGGRQEGDAKPQTQRSEQGYAPTTAPGPAQEDDLPF